MSVDIEKLISFYQEGYSLNELAKYFHSKIETIKKKLIQNNISIRSYKESIKINKKLCKVSCKYCGSTVNLKTSKSGRIFPVCMNCTYLDAQIKLEKRKKTTLDRYNVDNVAKDPEIYKKIKVTNVKRYSYDNPMKNKNIQEKVAKTCIKKYGVDNPCKSKEITNKIKQTNLKKYGYENVHQNSKIIEKATKSLVLRSLEKKEESEFKRLATVRRRYGCDYPLQSEEVKKKIKNTVLEKYGTESYMQSSEYREKTRKTHRENYWETFIKILHEKEIQPLFSREDYISDNENSNNFYCVSCNTNFISTTMNPHYISCPCRKHRSYFEDEIVNWLKSIDIKNIETNKKFYENGKLKYEIDIYLSDFNFGIDFNGLYWHSNLYKDKKYHKNKFEYFNNLNIVFIQIFENEWIFKQEIVQSIIKNKLGKNITIPARKCIIKEISQEESFDFLNLNHIQGGIYSKIRIGLYHNNELVCLGLFGKNRFSKESCYEIIRFTNKRNISIIGGFNRILNYFEKTNKLDKLISFVDLRYFSGNSYLLNNFVLELKTQPNYFYFKIKDPTLFLYNRIKFQKHKLSKLIENFDDSLSEQENMKNNGYLWIYDAGNIKFYKKYNIKN